MNPKNSLLFDPEDSVQMAKPFDIYAEKFGWLVRETDRVFPGSSIDPDVDDLLNNLKANHCTYHIGDSSFKNWQGLSLVTKGTKSFIDCDYILFELGLSEDIYSVSPETFYLNQVKRFSNIEIVLADHTEGTKHFITILNEKDQDTREQIYEIELRMFDFFETELNFSIYHFKHSDDIDNLIKDKTVLYYKNPYNEF